MIGIRLREERQRLGLSQTALAEVGGVKKLSQLKYEQEKRVPDANYLAYVAKCGIDVCYVVTGNRHLETAVRVDKTVVLRVAQAIFEWLDTTDREVTPQLLADLFTILHDGISQRLDDEFLADQIRAVG